jgi:predicted NAD/FAD-binding protein
MRIGIIGAGAAGLTASWLLQENHDITLFEKTARLGGHADTVKIEVDQSEVHVESGFEFFSDAMFPTFVQLLNVMGLELRRYPLTATIYTTDHRQNMLLPPFREGKIVWSGLRPASLSRLLQFQRTLGLAGRMASAPYTTLTVEQLFERLPVAQAFKEEFLWPFFLAQWCVEPDDFNTFSAYNAVQYATRIRGGNFSPPLAIAITGGTQAYIQKLAQSSPRIALKISATIRSISRTNDGYSVEEADGCQSEFDHLIVATGAHDAQLLLAGLPEAQERCKELDSIEYFKTTIAVHSDSRWMPAQRRNWSVVNVRYDGIHASSTIWHPGRSERPIFRSWVTYDEALPSSLYALTTYKHAKVNLQYYEAQKHLLSLQGRNHLWLAGLYMHDIDSHESAILSAVKIAQQLAPDSSNLRKLRL